MKKETKDKIKFALEENAIPIMLGIVGITCATVVITHNKSLDKGLAIYTQALVDKNNLLADNLGLAMDSLIEAIQKK